MGEGEGEVGGDGRGAWLGFRGIEVVGSTLICVIWFGGVVGVFMAFCSCP